MTLDNMLSLSFCTLICASALAYSLTPAESGSASGSIGGSAVPDVRVSVTVADNFVTLSCDVTGTRAGADDHKVQFFCPVLSGDVQCFGDCSPICTMQTDGSCRVIDPILDNSDSIACEKVVGPGRGAKSVRLRIDARQARLAGPWRCKFRGTSSATVSLAHQVPDAARSLPTETAAVAAAARATPGEPVMAGFTEAPMQAKATAASSDQLGHGVWKPDARRYPGDFAPTQGFERDPNLARFARADYIIGVLTIMCVSLLLNLGFCIRCILARHYVESRKRDHRKPLSWLGSCLCVSTVQVMLDPDSPDSPDEAAAATGAAGGGPSAKRNRRDNGRRETGDRSQQQDLQRQRLLFQQQQQQQQQQPCLYCLQADCRILYDDVARSGSECGSSCTRCGAGGSFRMPYEGNAGGRGSLLAVPSVPEEAAGTAASSMPATVDALEQQEDSESGFAASDPSSRLELSRRMLRKADTLLREANSLLLETEPTTDQQLEQ